MKAARQTTLRDSATLTGIGVHSGMPVTLTIHPSEIDCGVTILRSGIDGCPDREVRADVRAVRATEFATVLGDTEGPLCSTAEHVLAALSGLGVDNALIEIDGPEVPIMDGSARAFVSAVDRSGRRPQAAARRVIEILHPVEVTEAGKRVRLTPSADFEMALEIDFETGAIGSQRLDLTM